MAKNLIPDKLANFKVYLEGKTDLLGMADLTLPNIEHLTETIKGAGLLGEFETLTLGHTKSMKTTLTWRTVTNDQMTLSSLISHKLDIRGAFQEFDRTKGQMVTRSVKVLIQGNVPGNDLGKLEVGATSGGSTTLEVLYIKVDIDGKNKLEIDKLNFIYSVNGVDQLKDMRKALGMK